MDTFEQRWKRSNSVFALIGSLVFVALPLDSKYTQFFIDSGMDESWLYWLSLGLGSIGSVASLAGIIRPPLILGADRDGLSIGVHGTSISFCPRKAKSTPADAPGETSRRNSRRAIRIAWDDVRLITTGTIKHSVGDYGSKTEAALKIICADTIDLSLCDNMHGVQTGTEAYFAAKDARPDRRSFTYQEPHGLRANQNIVLIGQSYFTQNVDQVCCHLHDLAARARSRN